MTAPSITPSNITIRPATIDDHQQLTELFEQYRHFYKKPPNRQQASLFIKQRLQNQDSTILLATCLSEESDKNDESQARGFVQLYPTFSSTNMQKMYILNDLFVNQNYRKMSVATKLMNGAKTFAIAQQAHSIKLCTAIDNHQAKALYEQLGYQLIEVFDHYLLLLEKTDH